MFFHRPSITSTLDSAESIATLPPESDLDDEQIRALLALPPYLQEREASADRTQVNHPVIENSVSSSSGEFQDTESTCSGKLSHVPSPGSMLSRDQSLRPDTWNLSGTQGNFFGNPRSTFDSTQTPYQGIFHSLNQSSAGAVPVQVSTGTPVARGEERIGSTTPMPMTARRPSTMNSILPAEVPVNSMADQQRLQISELHFDKFPTPLTFSCWKIRFKTQVSSGSGFPWEAMLWIKQVVMVDSVDDYESS